MLRIWLPMTKDLRNQGLDDVTVTNNGATFNSAGKLGGCYAPKGLTLTNLGDLKVYPMTIAFWCKTTNTGTPSWESIVLIDDTSNSQIHGVYVADAARLKYKYNPSVNANSVNPKEWHHYTFIINNGNSKVYVDGILNSSSSEVVTADIIGRLRIGVAGTIQLNDFRIYDHCLSPMEVKELAKGLVLHYPLNRQGWGQENLAHNTYGLKPFSTSQVEFKAYDVGLLDVSNEEQITISFDLDMTVATGGSGFLQIYNTNYPGPHQIATGNALAERTLVTGQDIHERISYTTIMTTRSSSSYSTDRIEFYSNYSTENEIQISNIKIERGNKATPWCPNSSDTLATTMGLNSTTEYDCSGFCNNGEIHDTTITYSSDTPKYNVSTKNNQSATSSNYMLVGHCTLTDITAFTLAFWAKPTLQGTQTSGLISTSNGQGATDYLMTMVNQYDGVFRVCNESGTYVGLNASSYFIVNQWHHYVLTYNGSSVIFYQDGISKVTVSLTGKIKPISEIYPFYSCAGGVPRTTSGYMSDLRLYVTALSADDVKSLYQNSAYIDSSGNVYGAVHSEV